MNQAYLKFYDIRNTDTAFQLISGLMKLTLHFGLLL